MTTMRVFRPHEQLGSPDTQSKTWWKDTYNDFEPCKIPKPHYEDVCQLVAAGRLSGAAQHRGAADQGLALPAARPLTAGVVRRTTERFSQA